MNPENVKEWLARIEGLQSKNGNFVAVRDWIVTSIIVLCVYAYVLKVLCVGGEFKLSWEHDNMADKYVACISGLLLDRINLYMLVLLMQLEIFFPPFYNGYFTIFPVDVKFFLYNKYQYF